MLRTSLVQQRNPCVKRHTHRCCWRDGVVENGLGQLRFLTRMLPLRLPKKTHLLELLLVEDMRWSFMTTNAAETQRASTALALASSSTSSIAAAQWQWWCALAIQQWC